MTLGKQTFDLSKKDYTEKLGRIIQNFRVNSRLIGEPREFVLRSCRLCSTWEKMAGDPDVAVYVRNLDTAVGRKVKVLSLERGGTKQPVPKTKLVESLYPVKKTKSTATMEEKHYNSVKSAMRNAVSEQLRSFRSEANLPCVCYLSGKKLRLGHKIDVDHVGSSFSEIADSFLQLSNIKYTDITLVGPPTAKKFKDELLWKEWKRYHQEKANLALVCASANRSKGSDGYQTPEELYGSFQQESPEDIALDF